jgi:hypothetical protein
MRKNYSQLLKNFSSYGAKLKVKIVNGNFFMKGCYLVELFFVKAVFLVVALPFYLLNRQTYSKKDLESVEATSQSFQRAAVVSLCSLLVLAVAGQYFFSTVIFSNSAVHGAPQLALSFIGTRADQGDNPQAVNDVQVSPFDNTVTFSGIGPSYGHVALFVDNGQALIAKTDVGANGDWRLAEDFQGGALSRGAHSVFALFYSNDNAVIGSPTALKPFTIPDGSLSYIFESFGLNTFLTVLLGIGVLIFSVIQLRRPAKP